MKYGLRLSSMQHCSIIAFICATCLPFTEVTLCFGGDSQAPGRVPDFYGDVQIIVGKTTRVAVMGMNGSLACWTPATGDVLHREVSSGHEIHRMYKSLDGKDLLVSTEEHYVQGGYQHHTDLDRSTRRLFVYNAASMVLTCKCDAPAGPCLGAWNGTNLAVLACFGSSMSGRHDQIAAFRIQAGKAAELARFRVPANDWRIHGVRCFAEGSALVHYSLMSGDSGTSELAVYDCLTGETTARCVTTCATKYTERTAVSRNGRYCTAVGDKTCELRVLPSLELVERLSQSPPDALQSVAVSDSGRFVAMGGICVALWDVSNRQYRILDALDSDLIRSKARLSPEEAGPFGELYAYIELCVGDLAFSDDEKELLVVTRKGIYTIWDTATTTDVCLSLEAGERTR